MTQTKVEQPKPETEIALKIISGLDEIAVEYPDGETGYNHGLPVSDGMAIKRMTEFITNTLNARAVDAQSEGEEVELDCGDSSCYYAKDRLGQRTNGGCRCHLKFAFKHHARNWYLQNIKLRNRLGEIENAEASVCPEDVGFVEYIQYLKKEIELGKYADKLSQNTSALIESTKTIRDLRAKNERLKAEGEKLKEIAFLADGYLGIDCCEEHTNGLWKRLLDALHKSRDLYIDYQEPVSTEEGK